jgi:hypothetical protein
MKIVKLPVVLTIFLIFSHFCFTKKVNDEGNKDNLDDANAAENNDNLNNNENKLKDLPKRIEENAAAHDDLAKDNNKILDVPKRIDTNVNIPFEPQPFKSKNESAREKSQSESATVSAGTSSVKTTSKEDSTSNTINSFISTGSGPDDKPIELKIIIPRSNSSTKTNSNTNTQSTQSTQSSQSTTPKANPVPPNAGQQMAPPMGNPNDTRGLYPVSYHSNSNVMMTPTPMISSVRRVAAVVPPCVTCAPMLSTPMIPTTTVVKQTTTLLTPMTTTTTTETIIPEQRIIQRNLRVNPSPVVETIVPALRPVARIIGRSPIIRRVGVNTINGINGINTVNRISTPYDATPVVNRVVSVPTSTTTMVTRSSPVMMNNVIQEAHMPNSYVFMP